MSPTLRAGDHLILDPRAYRARAAAVGDVVVARHPLFGSEHIVKRVARCDGDRVWLSSDNAEEGTDSRSFGPVPHRLILGRVTARVGV